MNYQIKVNAGIDGNQKIPLRSTNIFSLIFFHYAYKVIKIGNKKVFEEKDLYALDDQLLFTTHFQAFQIYRKLKPNYSYSQAFAHWILKHTYWMIIGQICLNLVSVLNPFLVKSLINWFQMSDAEIYKGFVYSSVLFAVALSRPFLNQHSLFFGYISIVWIHILIFGSYFKKFEVISMSASRYLNIGLITSSITSDSVKIIMFAFVYAHLFVGPIMIAVFFIIICLEIGWVGVIGMSVVLMFTSLQIMIGRRMDSIVAKKSAFVDLRNKELNNSFSGIKAIKFGNWEKIVVTLIDKIRVNENLLTMEYAFIRGILEALAFVMPLIVSFVSIWIYQSTHEKLSLASVFYVISIYNMTSLPLRMFFFGVISFIEAKIALWRISNFCEFPEQNPSEDVLKNDESLPLGSIAIKNATLSFENNEIKTKFCTIKKSEKKLKKKKKGDFLKEAKINGPFETQKEIELEKSGVIFNNLTLEIKSNQFVAIVGKVGSGKSALLKSILGGLFFEEGSIRKNGKIAYIPQESFLINGLLRDNVTFGSAFQETRYNEVIKLSELLPDLEILPGGDLTEIGERGINLSGGQKQRIAIARALYAGADIFLIDDCLSAVDVHVGQNLFRNVLQSSLAGKTIVMVTHALQYLPDVDRVIMLDNGIVVADGPFQELIQSNLKFIEFVSEAEKEKKKKKDGSFNKNEKRKGVISSLGSNNKNKIQINEVHLIKNQISSEEVIKNTKKLLKEEKLVINENPSNLLTEQKTKGKLTKAESRFSGQVGLQLYYNYFKMGSLSLFFVCIFFFSAGIGGRIIADWWVGSWSLNTFPSLSFTQSLLIYLGLALVTFSLLIIRSYLWGIYMSRIAYKMFKNLLEKIMGKKMIFFDTTPLGQILNLASNDANMIDIGIPGSFLNFISNILQLLGIFILVSISNVILIPIIIILLIINWIAIKRYLKTSMELRRLEQISHSPIISNIIELYNGLAIFRAFDKIRFQEKIYTENVNRLLTVAYHDKIITIYVNFVTEIIMALLVGITFYLLCLGKIYNISFVVSNPNFIALTISWLVAIPPSILFLMYMLADTAKGMSSVQRMMKNIDNNDMERIKGDVNPPNNWPTCGEIRAVNISARYRHNMPLVIKNVSFRIRSCQKIGIVGRTGSGKSTVILLLTRLLELDNEDEGFIEIDGFKIHKMNLEILRSNLKVIPQDSYVLKGTLRSNIDPFNKFSDERVIEALKKSLLWESDFLENKLEMKERQQNFKLAKIKSKEDQNSSKSKSFNKELPQKAFNLSNIKSSKENNQEIVMENGKFDNHEMELFSYDKNEKGSNNFLTVPNEKESLQFLKKPGDPLKIEPLPIIIDHSNEDIKNETFPKHNKTPLQHQQGNLKKDSKIDQNILPIISKPALEVSKLNFEIEDKGKNLSTGEKQLICIARALLDVPKILLMDEATSNIDQFTDLQIQEVIKNEFKDTTIVTIAHRLNTIIQYDRIFVMEDGKIIEEGSPLELLTGETTFKELVRENGSEYEEKLIRLAQNLSLSVLEKFSQN